MKYILLALSIFSILTACTDDTKVCDLDVRTETRAIFRYVLNQQPRDTSMSAVILYAIGRENDSLYKGAETEGLQFAFDRTADSSRYYFQTAAGRPADTLTFRYRRQPHFVSAGCGFATFFTIDTAFSTNHVITSVVVNNSQVTTANEQNITIFF